MRAARPSDVAEVSALETELFGRDAWSRELVEGELTHCLRQSVVADEVGTLVGYAVLRVVGETADLERIGVSRHRRRRGVACALIEALHLDAFPTVLLEVRSDNLAAIALYTSVGFVPIATRRGYYVDGGDAAVMRRCSAGSG